MDGLAQDRGGIFLGDFFDFHAARRTGHENDAARGAVYKETEIEFALDVQPFFDQQTLDNSSGRPGLRGNQGHPENVARNLGGFLGGTRQLDAAAFAAAAGVDLRLDNTNVGFQALRGLQCFFLGESDFAAGSGDAITREYCLGLVLVDFHEGFCASVQA